MNPIKILCAVTLACVSPTPKQPVKQHPVKIDQPRVCERYEWQYNDRHVPKTEKERQRDRAEWQKLNCPLG